MQCVHVAYVFTCTVDNVCLYVPQVVCVWCVRVYKCVCARVCGVCLCVVWEVCLSSPTARLLREAFLPAGHPCLSRPEAWLQAQGDGPGSRQPRLPGACARGREPTPEGRSWAGTERGACSGATLEALEPGEEVLRRGGDGGFPGRSLCP